MQTYKAISATIQPITGLGCYNQKLAKTDLLFETVTIGYRALIIFDWYFADGNTMIDYQYREFNTIESAKKWLSNQYNN